MLSSVANRAVEESFVQLHPKDNFYQSVSFFPMPFALITTVNERGTTSIGPHSLAFPFEVTEQPSMMLVSRASSNTATNLRRTGKCALNFIEFDKKWLESVVGLGYPGQTPEEKMKDIPFTLTATPTQGFRDDPDYPLIIKQAFQVYECVADGTFEYKPHRVADAPLVESFFALRIKDVLLKESCKRRLDSGHEFPDMPISYGFRGGNEFWFTRHGEPFRIPVPLLKKTRKIAFSQTMRSDGPKESKRVWCLAQHIACRVSRSHRSPFITTRYTDVGPGTRIETLYRRVISRKSRKCRIDAKSVRVIRRDSLKPRTTASDQRRHSTAPLNE